MRPEKAMELIIEEFDNATLKFGKFPSAHHGCAVIEEELNELWDVLKDKKSFIEMEKEAKQVGAMALRFLVDLC